MADNPVEELFAGVAVWEAAIVGVCAFEMELLMDSVVGVERRAEVCAVAGRGRMTWSLFVAECRIRATARNLRYYESARKATRVQKGVSSTDGKGARSTPFGKGRRELSERFTEEVNRVGTGGFRQETCEMCKRLPRWSPLQVYVVMSTRCRGVRVLCWEFFD